MKRTIINLIFKLKLRPIKSNVIESKGKHLAMRTCSPCMKQSSGRTPIQATSNARKGQTFFRGLMNVLTLALFIGKVETMNALLAAGHTA